MGDPSQKTQIIPVEPRKEVVVGSLHRNHEDSPGSGISDLTEGTRIDNVLANYQRPPVGTYKRVTALVIEECLRLREIRQRHITKMGEMLDQMSEMRQSLKSMIREAEEYKRR